MSTNLNMFRVYLVLVLFCFSGSSMAINLDDHPKVKAVATKLVEGGHYNYDELEAIFAKAKVSQSVLDAMTSPAEYKFTWGKYRKLFLKEDRINQGADFWADHRAQLTRAEKEYGVPAEVIVAIIGVESKFGRFKGKHKVIDSLVSLVTGFPRRSKFFAGELEHFLILSKENNLDATAILGSYAGAVGFPQFISSSYRNYAIDFNNDGSTDLINQVDDAIGSIANYFIENGWKPGQPVTSEPLKQIDQRLQDLANTKRKVQYSAKDLRNSGAKLAPAIQGTEKLGVLMLDSSEIVHDKKSSGTYVVRAGDTACQIAERLSVSCKKLFSLNKLNAKGDIYRGQKLKIPGASGQKKKAETSDSGKWQVNSDKQDDQGKKIVGGPQPVYFYTHHNFYAITKYNHSVLYAMAVHDLSQAILKQYESNQASSNES